MRKLVIVCSLLMTGFGSHAQSVNGTNILSPNMASLGRYGQIPVNYANGLPNISIPIYTLSYAGIEIPVALNYHAGGIGIESHPGWVGLGWNLESGGAITRVVHHGPDDWKHPDVSQVGGYYFRGNKLNNGSWSQSTNMDNICRILDPNNSSNYNSNYIDDGEPDEFIFRFGNYSGSFFRDEQGQWRVKSDMNISFDIQEELNSGDFYLHSYNTNTYFVKLYSLFTKFTITDQNGYKYVFGGDENSIEFARGPYGTGSLTPGGYALYITPNSWMLTKVISPTGQEINLTYEKGGVLFRKFNYYAKSLSQQVGGSQSGGGGGVGYSGNVVNPVYLTKIETPLTKITFDRSVSYELQYSNPTGSGEGLQGDINERLAAWPDLIYAQSMQGVHNSNLQHHYQELDMIKVYDNQNNALRKKVELGYSDDDQVRLTLNRVIFESVAGTNGDQTYEFSYNNIGLMPAYRSMQSDDWGFYNGVNYTTASNQFLFPGWRPVNTTKTQYGLLTRITYPTGGYTDFEFESHNYSKHVQFLPSISVVNDNANLNAGGVRIKKITSYDQYGAAPVTKEFFYRNNYISGGTSSSGVLGGIPFYWDQESVHNPCTGSGSGDWMQAVLNDNAVQPISITGGNSVNYGEVTEKSSDGSYTVYKYSNFDNGSYLDEPHTAQYLYQDVYDQNSYALTSLDIERGQLLSKELYTNTNALVRKNQYEYNNDPNRKNSFIKAITYKELGLGANPCLSTYDLRAWTYKIYYYHNFLKKETQTDYYPSGTSVVSKEYTYDPYRNILSAKTVTGAGYNLIEQTKYNQDNDYYVNTTSSNYDCLSLLNLRSAKIKSWPIEKITKKETPATGAVQVLNGSLFRYNKDIAALKEIHDLDINVPLNATGAQQNYVTSTATTAGLQYNGNYKLKTSVDAVDNQANALSVTEHGKSIAYTRDYSGSYVSSKTVNAINDQVAFCGFDGSYTPSGMDYNKGNWNFDPAAINVQNAVGGKKSYNIDGYSITRAGLIAGDYIVSYWSNSGSITVNNTTPSFTGAPVGGWTYYEHKLLNVSGVTVAGSGLVDELRLYPVGAQMESYEYDPLLGMTAAFDMAGRITYYEYDGMGRLSIVRDQNGNIVKKTDYKVQKPE